MGTDWYACAIIGLKVDKEKLKALSSCEHDRRAGANFCPECGEPTGVYDGQRIKEYKVEFGADGDEAYVRLYSVTSSRNGDQNDVRTLSMPDMVGLANKKETMRKALDPLGLWEEKMFGLWAVLYCSY